MTHSLNKDAISAALTLSASSTIIRCPFTMADIAKAADFINNKNEVQKQTGVVINNASYSLVDAKTFDLLHKNDAIGTKDGFIYSIDKEHTCAVCDVSINNGTIILNIVGVIMVFKPDSNRRVDYWELMFNGQYRKGHLGNHGYNALKYTNYRTGKFQHVPERKENSKMQEIKRNGVNLYISIERCIAICLDILSDRMFSSYNDVVCNVLDNRYGAEDEKYTYYNIEWTTNSLNSSHGQIINDIYKNTGKAYRISANGLKFEKLNMVYHYNNYNEITEYCDKTYKLVRCDKLPITE